MPLLVRSLRKVAEELRELPTPCSCWSRFVSFLLPPLLTLLVCMPLHVMNAEIYFRSAGTSIVTGNRKMVAPTRKRDAGRGKRKINKGEGKSVDNTEIDRLSKRIIQHGSLLRTSTANWRWKGGRQNSITRSPQLRNLGRAVLSSADKRWVAERNEVECLWILKIQTCPVILKKSSCRPKCELHLGSSLSFEFLCHRRIK